MRNPLLLLATALPLPCLLAAGCAKPEGGGSTSAAGSSAASGKHAASAPQGAHGDHGGGGATATKPAPGQASVHFVFPQDGSKIFATSHVRFGVTGMTVTPAGQQVEDETRGHHHLIVDGDPVGLGMPVPFDDRHFHFGKGQTETELKLTPGEHTLTLQFANGSHLSYGPAMSKTIRVEVLPDPPEKGVYFVNLQSGSRVKSPFQVQFGVKGFSLRPAGEAPLDKTSGHHHLILDAAGVPLGQVVPADAKHIHFGKAQTETEVELPPGKHTLRLQLADGTHASYGEALSTAIEVEVE